MARTPAIGETRTRRAEQATSQTGRVPSSARSAKAEGPASAPINAASAKGTNARRAAARSTAGKIAPAKSEGTISIRPARPADLDQVIAIDAIVTGLEKRAYWRTINRRYGDAERIGRRFLVAESGARVAGFVIGEVRDWEFGEPPCGWVFAIDVHPDFRLSGVGTLLVDAMADWFRREGVLKMRTILARENTLILSFFRSMGMTTGPFIPLEMDLDRIGERTSPAGRTR